MTAIPTATGCLEVSKDRLRTSLANCYHFQRWQGNVWTVDEAKGRIYFESLPLPANNAESFTIPEWNELRPFAQIFYSQPPVFTLIAEPAGYSIRKTVTIGFMQSIPDGDECPQLMDREFGNFIGNIWRTNNDSQPGLVELSKISESGYFRIDGATFQGPERAQWDQVQMMGDFQTYEIALEIAMDVR